MLHSAMPNEVIIRYDKEYMAGGVPVNELKIVGVNQLNLVRNSGYGKAANPGATFIALMGAKYCDRCNNCHVSQQVEFCSKGSGWVIQNGNKCTCV